MPLYPKISFSYNLEANQILGPSGATRNKNLLPSFSLLFIFTVVCVRVDVNQFKFVESVIVFVHVCVCVLGCLCI